jgi:cellulase
MNPYRQKAVGYYGPSAKDFTIDTSKPFTVVTQFPADSNGKLQQVVRKYIQNGREFENAAVNVTGPIDDTYCAKNGATMFGKLGAMKGMGESMSRGMVLAMSIWWDEGGFMNWLDAEGAGPCSATEGDPKVVVTKEKNPTVKFSQIKWGDIGSTTGGKKRPQFRA